MKSAEKLRKSMVTGKVYRRQDLQGFTTAVDRDLRTLVGNGSVEKLHGGLYYRPEKNPYGVSPPSNEELIRAFLKTDDFLLTSYNHYNQLGLGLTQLHNAYVVYNHKRSGEFDLGGRRFRFRLLPAFPRELSKEYLLVDLLNNLERLPDDTDRVRRNLKSRLHEFDRRSVQELSEKYGRPSARRVLRLAYA